MKRFTVRDVVLFIIMLAVFVWGFPYVSQGAAPQGYWGLLSDGKAGSAAYPYPVVTYGSVATYGVQDASVNLPATPTDVVTLTGSATKTIRIKKVVVSGLANTTAGTMDVSLYLRLVADASGTSTTVVAAKYDSADASPTAVVKEYSVLPDITAGSTALKTKKLNFGLKGAAGEAIFDFTSNNTKPLYIRGVAQQLAINFNGQAVPSGGNISYEIIWEEF
jgi:hypothetical protein